MGRRKSEGKAWMGMSIGAFHSPGGGGDVRACELQGSCDVPGSEKLGSQIVGSCLLDIGAFPFICH